MARADARTPREVSVEHETCRECGFDGAGYDDTALLAALRSLGPDWRRLLAGTGGELRLRPAPTVWSAIEYAAHSRDVTLLHVFGVEQALTRDEPVFPAVEEGLADAAAATYGDSDPDAVLTALDDAARRLADQ